MRNIEINPYKYIAKNRLKKGILNTGNFNIENRLQIQNNIVKKGHCRDYVITLQKTPLFAPQ